MYHYCGKCSFVPFCHEAESHNRLVKQNRVILVSAIVFLLGGLAFTRFME